MKPMSKTVNDLINLIKVSQSCLQTDLMVDETLAERGLKGMAGGGEALPSRASIISYAQTNNII